MSDFDTFAKAVGLVEDLERLQALGVSTHDFDSSGRFDTDKLPKLLALCEQHPEYHIVTECEEGYDNSVRFVNRLCYSWRMAAKTRNCTWMRVGCADLTTVLARSFTVSGSVLESPARASRTGWYSARGLRRIKRSITSIQRRKRMTKSALIPATPRTGGGRGSDLPGQLRPRQSCLSQQSGRAVSALVTTVHLYFFGSERDGPVPSLSVTAFRDLS